MMRPLRLDYRRRETARPWAGWAGLVLAGLALAGLGWHHRQLAQDIELREAELGRLAQGLRPERAEAASPQGQRLEAELRQAREVLQQLGIPWEDLFAAVEAATTDEVALLGIEPEPRREEVRIVGEAKTYPAVLDYARRLEASAPLAGVHLQNHQIQTQDRERPVRFVLGAAWRGRP